MSSKKIVIVPTFCESHLIRLQVQNIIDTINPDVIIYNEGLWPQGTEGKKIIDSKWLDKYTLDGKRGFDYESLKGILNDYQKIYKEIDIILNEVDFSDCKTSTECWLKAVTNWKDVGIEVEEGDYIFTLEGDVFHHEQTRSYIEEICEGLEPNEGFRSVWVDFMGNQYYSELKQLGLWIEGANKNYMSRRLGIRYGGDEFYRRVHSNFMTTNYLHKEQGYGMLKATELLTYHYSWWRPDKFLQLRCDQLNRAPGYWEDFKEAIYRTNDLMYEKIKLRSKFKDHWASAWVQFHVLFDHPTIIKHHPCWAREMSQEESAEILHKKIAWKL